MSNKSWVGTTPEAAARRAGGRRRYNRQRRDDMLLRRYVIARMIRDGLLGMEWGSQSRLAEELGVTRSTICRDLQSLLIDTKRRCPTCGRSLTPEEWKRADRYERAQWATT